MSDHFLTSMCAHKSRQFLDGWVRNFDSAAYCPECKRTWVVQDAHLRAHCAWDMTVTEYLDYVMGHFPSVEAQRSAVTRNVAQRRP